MVAGSPAAIVRRQHATAATRDREAGQPFFNAVVVAGRPEAIARRRHSAITGAANDTRGGSGRGENVFFYWYAGEGGE